jgi:hypothetical protein
MTTDQIYKAYCDQLIQIENLQKEIARLQRRNDKPAWKSWNWPMYTPAKPKK